MNGFATTVACNILRSEGRMQLAEDVESEYRQVCAERDKARDTAVRFEQELARLESLYLALKEQGGGVLA